MHEVVYVQRYEFYYRVNFVIFVTVFPAKKIKSQWCHRDLLVWEVCDVSVTSCDTVCLID